MSKRIIFIIITAFFCLNSSFSQDTLTIEDDYINKADKWRFNISPYAWLASQATDVGGEKLRQSFNDLAFMTNFGFQLNTTARYKKLILSLDGTYANLGGNQSGDFLEIDLDLKQYILDMKLGYMIYSTFESNQEGAIINGWAIEANAGAKYWKNDVTLAYKIGDRFPIEGDLNEKQEWFDLMVGFKTRIFLSRTVLLGLSGNIGGFGIGSSSKLSYDFVYANTFKVLKYMSVTAGYRNFKYDRVDGEVENELKTTVSAYGPFLGVSFTL